MVKKNNDPEKIVFKCEECDFNYPTKELAKKCEDWCREYKSCNIEITQHAIISEKK